MRADVGMEWRSDLVEREDGVECVGELSGTCEVGKGERQPLGVLACVCDD